MNLFIYSLLIFSSASAKLKVITTTQDLAALVQAIAGDHIQVVALAKGTQDPHHVEPKPSFMIQMRSADLLIMHGLDLETAWIEPLIEGARNPKLSEPGRRLELGPLLRPLDAKKTASSRADGDVHPEGNPHFQLDPIRMGEAALVVAPLLGKFDPIHAKLYFELAQEFDKKMQGLTSQWKTEIQKAQIRELVTYHKSFLYFCDRFAIKCDLQIEPKPGLPPTVKHLLSLVEQMKERKLNTILIENFNEDTFSEKIKSQISELQILSVPLHVGGEKNILTTEQLLQKLVDSLTGKKP